MFEEYIGQTIGQTLIIRKEAESSLGVMFRGRSIDLARESSVYLANPELAVNEGFASRFLKSMESAAGIDHPGVLRVLDYGRLGNDPGVLYLVSEWLPGASLAELIEELKNRGSWITLGEAVRLVRQLALTLQSVRSSASPRLVDPHGIRFRPIPAEKLPYTPVFVGLSLESLSASPPSLPSGPELAYCSPEAVKGQTVDERSDIYSLGILLYELVTGQLPFPINTQAEAIRYHTRQPVPPAITARPDLPLPVDSVIQRSLQKSPGERYSSITEFADELDWTIPALEGLVTPPLAYERIESLMGLYLESLGEYRSDIEKNTLVGTTAAVLATQEITRTLKNKTPETEPEQVEVSIEQIHLTVEPGRTATTTIAIHNSSNSEGYFTLGVEGAPANWVTFSPREFALKAEEQKSAQLILKPPRVSTTRAGRYPLTVKAVDTRKTGRSGEATATLTVGAFNQFRLDLETPQVNHDQSARMLITNTGNIPDTFTIAPYDPAGELGFEPTQSQVKLNPGQVGQAEFRPFLQSLRFLGGLHTHPYNASVVAASGGKQSQPGEFISKSVFPPWIPIVLLFLCICVSIFGLVYITQTTLRGTSAQRTAIAVQTGTVAAIQNTVQSITQTAQALSNANQSTLQSVTLTSQAVTMQASTAQVQATSTALSSTATAMAQAATAQSNSTAAAIFTQTAAVQATANSGLLGTATAVSLTATAQTGLIQTATAQVGFAQTATAQSSLFRTATAQAALIQTVTAQAAAATAQAAAATSQAATATAQASTPVPPQRKVAYLYLTSTGLAAEYRDFLKPRGYTLDAVPLDAIPSANLTQYTAILIAPETGKDGQWGDTGGSWANAIVGSNLPVIGLGEGGFNFFGKINLLIGWPNGIDTSAQEIVALNVNDPIWKTPNNIPIPANNVLTLYNKNSQAIAVLFQPPFPSNIIGYGQWPANVNQFPVIMQEGRFLLWGFRESPKEFTSNGSSLFLNFLDFFTKP